MILARSHGRAGPTVVAIHGGPAAAGSAAPVARGLAQWCKVLEPWQRGSGDEPLTVRRHVADLHELIAACCPGQKPALVGMSWGAMLALAYAAEHPDTVGPLVLVGCGTFDPASRRQLRDTLAARTTEDLQRRLAQVEQTCDDPGERMMRQHEIGLSLFNYDPVLPAPAEPDSPPFDLQAHVETWNDMLAQQQSGVYPQAFRRIASPVLMLHGDYDPHPGPMIRDSLLPHIPQLEYLELERCGHEPWLERSAREPFFAQLRAWLSPGGAAQDAKS